MDNERKLNTGVEVSADLIEHIQSLETPLIISISGFGGAGKSSFAERLGLALGAPVIGVDSFMKDRTSQEYSRWEIMDFDRLEKEVIRPFLSGTNPLSYGHFDWETNGVNLQKEVNHDGILIIEGVGLFRPELNEYFGYKIWVDCPMEEAIRRGKKRDREVYHNPQDESWDGVWKRNDREYLSAFNPKDAADRIVSNGLATSQKIIFIIGLPGSGKTTYLEKHKDEFSGALVCDDYYTSATVRPRKSLKFEGSAYYEDVREALESGKNVVMADILFCDPEYLEEAQEGLTRLLSELDMKADIEYRFFENDPSACIENILRRSRPERVEKELAYIKETESRYRIPDGAIILPVYRPREK